jgi:hypothetical protein
MLLTVNLGKISQFLANFKAKYAPSGHFAAEKFFLRFLSSYMQF